ncbi:MAG: LacI family DNA-binding transcriptional regulator [Anaerolineae bacterium]|nr:LacI family DNA-binding transcriptional regulator [Anaerolineae bacterium]
MPVTLTDVAQVAGVSIATASRVLSNSSHPVNKQTRDLIVQVANQLGYRPNLIARSLRTDRTYTIGVVVENVAEFFTTLILQGILDYFAGSAYAIFILNTFYDPDTEVEAVNSLLMRAAEGIIFIDTALHSVEDTTTSVTPSIFVNRKYEYPGEQCVIPDNRYNAHLATEHLIKLGHSQIAYIGGPDAWEATQERHAGYKEALKQYGLPYRSDYVAAGNWQLGSGFQAAKGFLHLADPPTAIFASSDKMALGAVYGIQERGLRVPDDIAVVGMDNRPFAEMVRPSLTTIVLPGYKMGYMAADHLLKKIEGMDAPSGYLPICGEIVVRKSCGAPKIDTI